MTQTTIDLPEIRFRQSLQPVVIHTDEMAGLREMLELLQKQIYYHRQLISTYNAAYSKYAIYYQTLGYRNNYDSNGNIPVTVLLRNKEGKFIKLSGLQFIFNIDFFIPYQVGDLITGFQPIYKEKDEKYLHSPQYMFHYFSTSACITFSCRIKIGSYPVLGDYGVQHKHFNYRVQQEIETPDIDDEFGKPADFSQYHGAAVNPKKLSSTLEEKLYTLVGTSYYAPQSKTDGIFCVLFARDDNQYDENAIQVFRWMPENDKHSIFELGYISRAENEKLHQYMFEKDRFLFGRIDKGKIQILSNIAGFHKTFPEYRFPFELCNI